MDYMKPKAVILVTPKTLQRPKYKGLFSIDYRERKSHSRGVYPIQDTSRMGKARVKQEEETDTRVIVIE